MKHLYRVWMPVVLAASWTYYGALLIRQKFLLSQADAASDAGLSFGYHFLLRFGGSLLMVLTAFIITAMVVLGRKKKLVKQLKP